MKKLFSAVLGLAAFTTISGSGLKAADAPLASAYDFTFTSIDGTPMPLAQWRGKALLVVNTASMCGFTGQYKGLQELWSAYEAKGLVVVGVPSNDFMGQEPKNEKEIKKFCEGAYGITFPMSTKEVVTGGDAHPFYKWVAERSGAPRWNFYKYLIGRDGRLVDSYSPMTSPTTSTLVQTIEKVLAEQPSAQSFAQ